jgi:hypothetical protein
MIKFYFHLLPDATTRRKLHEGILNLGEEDEMKVYGYKKSLFKTIVCYLFIGLTLGILRLIMHWWSHWLLLATHKACSLDEAEQVLVEEKFQGKHTIYYVKAIVNVNEDTVKLVETLFFCLFFGIVQSSPERSSVNFIRICLQKVCIKCLGPKSFYFENSNITPWSIFRRRR